MAHNVWNFEPLKRKKKKKGRKKIIKSHKLSSIGNVYLKGCNFSDALKLPSLSTFFLGGCEITGGNIKLSVLITNLMWI